MAIVVRRSFALTLLPALLGIVILHIFGRERPWTHEWLWAIYQFNFVTVLLGPVVAGLGAWEGVRFSRCRTLLGTSNRILPALVAAWLALLAWVFVVYAVGLAVVAAMVILAGTPGVPGARDVLTTLPAFSLLAAEAGIGLAVGWTLRNPLTAPACAVGSFLLTLYLYTRGPGQLIIVGGATDSLIGLAPRQELQAAQVLCYAALCAAALVVAAHSLGWRRRNNPLVAPAIGMVALLSVVLVAGQGGTILERRVADLRCFGTQPQVCAGPGYVRRLAETRTAMLPYLNVLRTAGVPVPRRFAQGQEPGNPDIGPISLPLLQGRQEDAGLLALSAYLRKSCDFKANPQVLEAHQMVSYWLFVQVTNEIPYDPSVPDVLRNGSLDEQRRWVRSAITTIRRCGA